MRRTSIPSRVCGNVSLCFIILQKLDQVLAVSHFVREDVTLVQTKHVLTYKATPLTKMDV